MPVIEDYLSKGIESDRSALLLELLKLDREYRAASGRPLLFADYLARFPKDERLLRSVWLEAETIASDSNVPTTPQRVGRDLERVSLPRS